jgi:hypothetical protein
MMDDYTDRYGNRFVQLVDKRATMKVFEFDQTLLMPTAESYRALVEQAKIEIKPKVTNYLSKNWSEGTIENLSFFVMAVAVYARSVLDPPITIDVGKVLLKTVSACNLRCARRKETGGGCRAAMNGDRHHLPKCIKLPRGIAAGWGYVKRYIATGGAICSSDAIGVQEALGVKISPRSDFAPAASC